MQQSSQQPQSTQPAEQSGTTDIGVETPNFVVRKHSISDDPLPVYVIYNKTYEVAEFNCTSIVTVYDWLEHMEKALASRMKAQEETTPQGQSTLN